MTPEQTEQYFINELSFIYEDEEARQLFYLTLEHISGWNRSKYLSSKREVFSDDTKQKYLEVLNDLKKGRPMQHIFAEAHFYGLKFKVNESVLIPRPETEELIYWMLTDLTAAGVEQLDVLDIGTGSGCIAITLKKKTTFSNVFALDVSADAIAVARENAVLNDAAVNFIQADIRSYEASQKFHVIVSNPPYIRNSERSEMHQNVLDYEPHLALFVSDDDPLIFYTSIADFALSHLHTSGRLFFEINEYLGAQTVEMLAVKGFKNIILKKDMQGKDRMIGCNI